MEDIMDTKIQQIPERIRELRKAARMNQEQFYMNTVMIISNKRQYQIIQQYCHITKIISRLIAIEAKSIQNLNNIIYR